MTKKYIKYFSTFPVDKVTRTGVYYSQFTITVLWTHLNDFDDILADLSESLAAI